MYERVWRQRWEPKELWILNSKIGTVNYIRIPCGCNLTAIIIKGIMRKNTQKYRGYIRWRTSSARKRSSGTAIPFVRGIPYLDLWNGCYLNPNLPFMYDRTKTPDQNLEENTGFYIDGQHLTSYGYDVTADIIESWLKTL